MKKLKYEMLFTILFMTIAFAAVTSNILISGTTQLANNPDDFNVYFSDVEFNGVQDLTLVNSERELVFSSKFDTVGEKDVISYDITNASSNYAAKVLMSCTESTNNLTITNDFDMSTPIGARSTRTGSLTVELSNPVTSEVTQEIVCTMTVNAVEISGITQGTVPQPVVPAVLKPLSEFPTEIYDIIDYGCSSKVILEDTINIPDNAEYVSDVSVAQNNSIVAFLVNLGEEEIDLHCSSYYDTYIQSNGRIRANEDMYDFFSMSPYVSGIELLDTRYVVNMGYLFSSTSNTYLDLSSWDTSNVTNMYAMFEWCTSYNVNLGYFDTSNVTNMSDMFRDAREINTVITIRNPNVESYDEMFYRAATSDGAQIIVNYTSETEELVEAMIATKSENSNVVKGSLVN